MGGRKSSGPSAYEIQKQQELARLEAERRQAAERAGRIAKANASASGGVGEGGEASVYDGGALSTKQKKGATLAGEGAQTFGNSGSLGG